MIAVSQETYMAIFGAGGAIFGATLARAIASTTATTVARIGGRK